MHIKLPAFVALGAVSGNHVLAEDVSPLIPLEDYLDTLRTQFHTLSESVDDKSMPLYVNKFDIELHTVAKKG